MQARCTRSALYAGVRRRAFERVQKAEVMPHLVRCSRALVIGPRGGAWAPDGGPYGDAIDTTSRILCQICLSEYAAGRRLDKNVHAVVDIRS